VSHVAGLLVVVDVVDVSGETEVGDLHHVVFSDQNVPGCQVSVDALRTQGSELGSDLRSDTWRGGGWVWGGQQVNRGRLVEGNMEINVEAAQMLYFTVFIL